MMVSNPKNDVGCGLGDTDISGLSDLYFPQEDKRNFLSKMLHKKEHERAYNLCTCTRVTTGVSTYVLN